MYRLFMDCCVYHLNIHSLKYRQHQRLWKKKNGEMKHYHSLNAHLQHALGKFYADYHLRHENRGSFFYLHWMQNI